MHIADYTKIFATPDELADFLMLEVKEQDRILAELAQVGRIGGVTMCCWVENVNLSDRRPHQRENDD
jgi:hypothetical protein